MPTKNAKRSTSFIRLLWPAAAANGTPVLALRMARTPHWAFGCKPDQKGASPSQALGGAGGLWRSLWLAGLLWSTARGSHAGRVQGRLWLTCQVDGRNLLPWGRKSVCPFHRGPQAVNREAHAPAVDARLTDCFSGASASKAIPITTSTPEPLLSGHKLNSANWLQD